MSNKIGLWWLISSGLLVGIYCLNVALGKIALLSDTEPLFSMDDVTVTVGNTVNTHKI